MSLERYVVEAVVLEQRSPGEIARLHRLHSKSWVYELVARFREGGYEALSPRSRRPRSCSHQVEPALRAAIVQLRRELEEAGHDFGAATIAHHLVLAFDHVPAVATIWRIFSREGLIAPQPKKRPRSSASRPTCPTRCGRATPPTGTWPMAVMLKSSTTSTTTPGCSSPATLSEP
ncbi:MAG: helix-turn-helix domain-containing protein [Candidatus Dormibacteria bacterium]